MGLIMKNGVPYASGSEIPEGGTKGQVLAKASDLDGDFEWTNGGSGGGSGTGETPTLDDVLKKGNETDNTASFTGIDSSTEISNSGAYITGIGAEGMRQFSISQDRISAVDNLVGTITPKFVVPFEPSGEDQVAMSDAVKGSFQKALGIANDTFIFDVDSDQFTEDQDNPDGKHYGMTITSPTYDELLAMLNADKFVYVRLLYNSGNAYEIMQLFHNANSIYGRYFDVEFPQKRLQFASAYVNKRNNDTYFGTYQDYIVGGGTVDQTYDATSTNAQSGTAVVQAVEGVESAIGDLTTLNTTAQDNLVNAVNELKFGLDGLGEPFRVKEWSADNLTATIPSCSQEVNNTNIDKVVYTITGQEAVDYQVVGMIAYQLQDASANRINAWPVCQFTGGGQSELHVRFMCAGTSSKSAKSIKAWVLLKHR